MNFFVGQRVKLPGYIIPQRGTVTEIITLEAAPAIFGTVAIVEVEIPRIGKRAIGVVACDLELAPEGQTDDNTTPC